MILALCLMLGTLAACGTGEKDTLQNESTRIAEAGSEQDTASVTTSEAVQTTPATAEEDFKLPEDGVRPIAVMIDNQGTRVLPQGGLNKAQIVYEVIVEGGETRLMPVFWGTNPKMIGPVRSSRDYFLDYSMENDAIYTHYGWSPKAKADISRLKINNINGLYVGKQVFHDLTKDRANWQDSYTTMEKLLNYAKKIKYRMTTDRKFPFTYNTTDIVPADGQTAVAVVLKYNSANTSRYEYDSTTRTYKRFRHGKPHMERVSGKQLEAKNILIQFTPNYSIKGDAKGRQEMNTTGSGKGYLVTCGKAVRIKWSKESRSAQTKYTDEAGNKITLNRGQTWIQIMPLTADIAMK
jgi:hypothetical protein